MLALCLNQTEVFFSGMAVVILCGLWYAYGYVVGKDKRENSG